MGLNASIPYYVTRRNADGQVAEYSQSIWMTLLASFMVWLNITLWGLIGVVLAGVTIVDAVSGLI